MKKPHNKLLDAALCAACRAVQVPMDGVMSRSREARFVDVRIGIWLALHEAGWTAVHIGEMFNRNHTTILHGIAAARERRHLPCYSIVNTSYNAAKLAIATCTFKHADIVPYKRLEAIA